MTRWSVARFRLTGEVLLRQLSPVTLGAAALLLLVTTVAVGALLHIDRRAAESQFRLAATRTQAAMSPGDGGLPTQMGGHDTRRLHEFESVLGNRADLDRYLKGVFAAASWHGVELSLGEYRLRSDAAGRFQRYEATLPVKGSFVAIQQFSRQVLLDLPFAALEEVSLRRDATDASEVQARLRFALFLSSDGNAVGRKTHRDPEAEE